MLCVQVIIVGSAAEEDTQALLTCVHAHYLPNKVLHLVDGDASGPHSGYLRQQLPELSDMVQLEGKATAYVCKDYACSTPVNTVAGLHELLQQK